MIEISTSAATVTVTVSGDLDVSARNHFVSATLSVTGLTPALLVIDVSEVEFIDSTGAAFLISLAHAIGRHHGVAVLRGASDQVRFVLEVCGAGHLFRQDEVRGSRPGAP